MRLQACASVVMLAAGCWYTAVSAQSLADVARREAERRKAVGPSVRVYTNADLPERHGSPTSTSRAVAPSAPPAAAPGADAAAPPPPGGEAAWRARISDVREALARAEILADALQSRVNALAAAIAARDDPAQRAVLMADREKALAELERVRTEARVQAEAEATIQEEARRAGVPPGWLREGGR